MTSRNLGWLLPFAFLCAVTAAAQTYQPILQPHQHFVDGSGSPCAGCSLYSYLAGSTTPAATYTDASGSSLNTNPIVLDSSGSASIWIGTTSYKFTLVDASGTTLWTVDQVQAVTNGFMPLTGGTFTGPVTFNSTINGHASQDVALAGSTMTGNLIVPNLNKVVKVDQLAGASADVQLNACYALLASGGICDARGYGATTQKINATVVNPSGVPITVLFDPATKLQPGSANLQMFHLNRGIQMFHPHVDIVGSGFQLTYTGTVFLIDDNVRDGDDFILYDANVDNVNYSNRAQPAAGSIALKFNATNINTSSQVGAKIDGFQCKYLDNCIVIDASGGGFANSNLFSNTYLDGCRECLVLNGTVSPVSSVEGNLFSNLFIQSESWTLTPIIGTNYAAKNLITGCAIWDNPSTNDISWDGTSTQNYTACFFTKAIAGSSGNSYWNVGSEVGVPSLLSQSYVRGTYFQGTGTPTTYATQGNYTVWNASAGNGESDFVNGKGSGAGGFNWYNVANGAGSVGSALMGLDSSGNLSITGLYKVNNVQIATTNLSDNAGIVKHCGESTFAAATSGSAVTCSQVTAGSHCSATWQGTPGAGILGVTPGAGTVAVSATSASTGTASVFCSIN